MCVCECVFLISLFFIVQLPWQMFVCAQCTNSASGNARYIHRTVFKLIHDRCKENDKMKKNPFKNNLKNFHKSYCFSLLFMFMYIYVFLCLSIKTEEMRRLWVNEWERVRVREKATEDKRELQQICIMLCYAVLCVLFVVFFLYISNTKQIKSITHAHYRKMPPLCNSLVSEKRENACFVWVEFCVCVYVFFIPIFEPIVLGESEWERAKESERELNIRG